MKKVILLIAGLAASLLHSPAANSHPIPTGYGADCPVWLKGVYSHSLSAVCMHESHIQHYPASGGSAIGCDAFWANTCYKGKGIAPPMTSKQKKATDKAAKDALDCVTKGINCIDFNFGVRSSKGSTNSQSSNYGSAKPQSSNNTTTNFQYIAKNTSKIQFYGKKLFSNIYYSQDNKQKEQAVVYLSKSNGRESVRGIACDSKLIKRNFNDWEKIVPETMGEAYWEWACNDFEKIAFVDMQFVGGSVEDDFVAFVDPRVNGSQYRYESFAISSKSGYGLKKANFDCNQLTSLDDTSFAYHYHKVICK